VKDLIQKLWPSSTPDEAAPSPEPPAAGEDTGESLADMQFRLEVEAVLDEARPMLHADGGDIELVAVTGRSARVRMTGACDGCASASFTLRLGIEKRLRDAIPGFEDLIPV
jgi:Fe-S cluster biogenesis protein NfuA